MFAVYSNLDLIFVLLLLLRFSLFSLDLINSASPSCKQVSKNRY